MVGSKVKAMRIENEWSMRELARRANLPVATLQRVERGGPVGPTAKTLEKLARAFGSNTVDIFFDFDVCKRIQIAE